MRGNPLRELIVVLVLVAVLVPFILKLAQDPQVFAPARSMSTEPQDLVVATLHIEFVHPPVAVSLGHEDEIRWRLPAGAPQTEYEDELMLNLSEGLLELPVTIQWAAGTPRTAVTLSLEPEGMEARKVTFWGEGELTEFIELNWDE